MTSFFLFLLVFLSLVAPALVVYATRVLLAGRLTPDLTGFDQPDQPVLDRTDTRYWKLGFYLNPQALPSSCPSAIRAWVRQSILAILRGGVSRPASCWEWPC